MKILYTTLTILLLSPLYILAQEDTTLSELVTNSEVKAAEMEQLDQQDEERTQEIENMLGFTLPEYTDNPSYVITFTDPSPDKQGVELELDSKSYTKITSPYTLPALSIGKHSVNFRFYDEESNVQLLEYDLIIIPRTPITQTPVIEDTSITISGTALAGSEVIYTLSANTYNESGSTMTDVNGSWSLTINSQDGFSEGIYTFTAYTRKYGYASNLSTPVIFGLGEGVGDLDEDVKQDIFFSFANITKDNIKDVFLANTDLIILVGSNFLLGCFLSLVLKSLVDGKSKNRKIKDVEDILNASKKKDSSDSKTLRELFEKDSPKEDDKEPTKQESIINKDMFLKTYKHVDPDTTSGKEKSSKEIKKKIKVSLTSPQ